MTDGAVDVVEFLLTANGYTNDRTFDENDLPPAYRNVFWSVPTGGTDGDEETESTNRRRVTNGGIERPLATTTKTARAATGVQQPWEAVSELMFTDRDDFSGTLSLTDREIAEEWYVDRV